MSIIRSSLLSYLMIFVSKVSSVLFFLLVHCCPLFLPFVVLPFKFEYTYQCNLHLKHMLCQSSFSNSLIWSSKLPYDKYFLCEIGICMSYPNFDFPIFLYTVRLLSFLSTSSIQLWSVWSEVLFFIMDSISSLQSIVILKLYVSYF